MTHSSISHAVAVLKDLLETSNEGQRGFALAAQDNREPGVVQLLKDGEEFCSESAVELLDQVRLLGGPPDAGRTATVPVHRGWISFKAVAIRRDTKLILEECERGTDYARARYEDAMQIELPPALRAILERQYQRIRAIQGRVQLLRNRYPATEIPQAIGCRHDSR